MRRQIVIEEQGLLSKDVILLFSFCCGGLQLTETLQQRWPGIERTGARQEEKEADGQGISVCEGCRVLLLGEHECTEVRAAV